MLAFLGGLPRSVWIVLAIVAALGLGTCAHDRAVHKHYNSAYAQGKADEASRIAKKAKELEAKANRLANEIRSKADAKARDIAVRADDLRVSGPGRSRCAVPPAPTSGHKQASGNGDAAGPQVPTGDSAAVPWPWLVNRAEQADLNRAEVLAWREWYERLKAEWQKP